jgi:hypothetical protein
MTIAKHVLTVYNKYMNQGEWAGGMPPTALEAWNRTVIKFGQWEDTTDRQADTNGITQINKLISIIIPKTANTQGKKYVTPLEWAKLPADKKILSWTLNAGVDYIAFGEGPEITSAYKITNMTAEFRCCLIKAMDDLSNQPILPHIEISGV